MDNYRSDDQRQSLGFALQHAGLSAEQLWLRYFALGGDAGPIEVDAYIHGLGLLDPLQRDIAAHAVNERLDELTSAHRASYTRTFRAREPRSEPLEALVTLLLGAELAPPERLPVIAAAAGRALGVQITIYLIDYAQRCLHPLSVTQTHTNNGTKLDVDSTLAGRAFRQVQMLPAETPTAPHLWVPLLDGVERLGVLEVGVASLDDLYDPGLRTQCRWLSTLLGHLVTAQSQYGDGVDLVRIRTPRDVGSELVWSLLPPLTAGVDNFVVSALLEPSNEVNGDAFDYALSETTAQLIVLDAVGHDLRSGLIAATAVAAYRSARHAGHGLYEQSRVIDEAVNQQFGGTGFATAVLIELDLGTGRLRYINAGHPPPLIMRSGKIVRPLTGGRRRPLGLGGSDLVVGQESLQPDDWLVLHTDGVTEARDETGEFFGDARLTDFLQREAAAGHPPPETTRRLVQAVLDHQHGVLQDDATVLLARWTAASQIIP